ncbi:MAG: DUF547 domain-containing protein [Vampirovibrio sp.]|nr:DUF547 domain-containing protein [Vampirovibrio sp.]
MVNRVKPPKNPVQRQVTEWTQVLSQQDTQGHLDLFDLKTHPQPLNTYLDQLAQQSPVSHPNRFKTTEKQLAYWLNAYNTLALKLIIDAAPVNDLKDIPGFFSIRRYILGGIKMSLSDIQTLLARQYPSKPYLVFALSDFSHRTPAPVQLKASDLQKQLKQLADKTLQQPGAVTLEDGCGPIHVPHFLSELTETNRTETILSLLNIHAPPRIRGDLYRECNWQILFDKPDTRIRQSL